MRKLRCKACGKVTYTASKSIEKCPFCGGPLQTDLRIVKSDKDDVDEGNDIGC